MTYHFNALKFALTIKIWRNMNNITSRDMAELSGIATSTYGFIETNDRTPTMAEFTSLCNIVGFQPKEFFTDGK